MIAASRSKALRGSVGSRVSEHTFVLDTCPQIAAGSLTEAIAEWMLAEIEREGLLWQCEAVEVIPERFGSGFVYENAHGHLGIVAEVLAAFRELTADRVVWSRGGKLWRLREPDDGPGRGQR